MRRVFTTHQRPLLGTVDVPSDKSLSHRAVIFAAMAEGASHLSDILDSADVRSSIGAVKALGADVRVDEVMPSGLRLTVNGWGARGPVTPTASVNCGNSGTTVRLLLGVVSGWPIQVTFTGDESLSRRPMRRVTEPLHKSGAVFQSDEGTLPVTVSGAATSCAVHHDIPVASAQVKTALLLAGLRSEGRTSVTEPAPSRDHTERLLPAFCVPVVISDDHLTSSVTGPAVPAAADYSVPGDPSSAAFPLCAAALVPGSEVLARGVSLNPTRTGFISVMRRMGAAVTIERERVDGAEPVGDVRVTFKAGLVATTILSQEVPSLVDEVPVLALLASSASGTTRFEGVGELRVKESDRLAAVAEGLRALGVTTRVMDDVLEVDGPAALCGTDADSLGDHRLAMTWALAGLVSDGSVAVERFEAIDVSYPGFADDIERLGSGSAEA